MSHEDLDPQARFDEWLDATFARRAGSHPVHRDEDARAMFAGRDASAHWFHDLASRSEVQSTSAHLDEIWSNVLKGVSVPTTPRGVRQIAPPFTTVPRRRVGHMRWLPPARWQGAANVVLATVLIVSLMVGIWRVGGEFDRGGGHDDRVQFAASSQESTPVPTALPTPVPTALPKQPIPVQGTDADGNGLYTSEEFQAAIIALFGYYEWPADYVPNVEAVVSRYGEGDLADDEFEVPGEYTVVGMYYMCAWGQTWLDAFADGDTATMDASMQHLRDELALSPMRPPSTLEHDKAMYDKASLGDPAILLQWATVNCGGKQWVEHPATPS